MKDDCKRSPPFEKGGQGGFEAFLNPPKSPLAKWGLAGCTYASVRMNSHLQVKPYLMEITYMFPLIALYKAPAAVLVIPGTSRSWSREASRIFEILPKYFINASFLFFPIPGMSSSME